MTQRPIITIKREAKTEPVEAHPEQLKMKTHLKPANTWMSDGFYKSLLGKRVRVETTNGKNLTGVLEGWDQFNIMLAATESDGKKMLMKHALLSITEEKI